MHKFEFPDEAGAWSMFFASVVAMELHPGNKARQSWSDQDLMDWSAAMADMMWREYRKRRPPMEKE